MEQRTHVGSHATGLLLHRALDDPVDGGYGIRKVGWRCNNVPENPSMAAGIRLGFKPEGVVHDLHMVPPGGIYTRRA